VILLLIVVPFFVVMMALGWVISRRDRRAGRAARDATDMWRDGVREQKRDMRVMDGGPQRFNPDFRWTEWGRRNHPDR
jgi:hypothetical protein